MIQYPVTNELNTDTRPWVVYLADGTPASRLALDARHSAQEIDSWLVRYDGWPEGTHVVEAS